MPRAQPKVGIVGAGHAGVEAARTAAAQGAAVTLFSAESALPYYRPRLIALAFGQVSENEIGQHPVEWYAANGIELRLETAVEAINPDTLAVRTATSEEAFDALVVATGAGPVVPDCLRLAPDVVFPLWTFRDVLRIRERARPGASILVAGGGLIGIETALRAADAGLEVALVEKLDRLMPGAFGPNGSGILAALLGRKGIRVLTSRAISTIRKSQTDQLAVELAPDGRVEVGLVALCLGARRDLTLAEKAELRTGQGILVDASMRTSARSILACGDIAQLAEEPLRCSVPSALGQAKVAGHNACAAPRRAPLLSYEPKPAILSFKYKDVELRSAGAIPAGPAEEVALEGHGEAVHRVRVVRNGATVGVQMIGDCRDFDNQAKNIMEAKP